MIPSPAIYRRVFGTDEGRIVLADLMEFVGLWNNGFYEDPRKAERCAGQRDVLMFLIERAGISDDYLEIARALFSVPAKEPEPHQTEADSDGAA